MEDSIWSQKIWVWAPYLPLSNCTTSSRYFISHDLDFLTHKVGEECLRNPLGGFIELVPVIGAV